MKNIKTSDFENFDLESVIIRPNSLFRDEDYDKHDLTWQEAKRYAEDTGHRGKLIRWVKRVVSWSLVLTFLILILNRILALDISDTVLIALLTTTTANILGLAFIVLKGMFK
jgi:hypothetical protein